MKIGGFEITKLHKVSLLADDSIGITNEGREAADANRFNDSRQKVLETICASGSTTCREVAEDTGFSVDSVKRAVGSLVKKGLVRRAGAGAASGYDDALPVSRITPAMEDRE